MEGWLKKESGGNKSKKGPSLGSIIKKEQRRWFLLNGGTLSYYAEQGKKGEKGAVTLAKALVEGDESSENYSFLVTSPDRVLALRAENRDDLAHWLGALREACGVNQEREQKRLAEAKQAAAKEAEAAARLVAAATVLQKTARGMAGRDKAANTSPPTAAACKLFVVDTNAAVFGTCMCGFKKEGHSARALKGKSMKLSKKTSTELRAKMVQREKATCTEFKVNMDPSLPFGTCMCGRPRAEHTEAALRGGAVSLKLNKTGSAELRAKMVQREKVSCAAFRVSMDPSLPFGTCLCGAPRADHTEAALSADAGPKTLVKKTSTDVRAGMVQPEEKRGCTAFRVSMDPSLSFGTCVCGQPRAEHTAAALSAEAGPKSLVKKTSTDVRAAMDAKQEEIGTAVETQGARVDVAYGLVNTNRTAADEEAAVRAAISARAGGVDKAAALSEFNDMMMEALTPRTLAVCVPCA